MLKSTVQLLFLIMILPSVWPGPLSLRTVLYAEEKRSASKDTTEIDEQSSQRLERWMKGFAKAVKMDDGISDWKFQYRDEQLAEFYALINEMGGVYVDKTKRQTMVSSQTHRIAFFSAPARIKDETGQFYEMPGVLLIHPISDSGVATFYAIDQKGQVASGVLPFDDYYGTGGAIYTPKHPRLFFSTAIRPQRSAQTAPLSEYFQFSIAPQASLEKHYGSDKPLLWTDVEKTTSKASPFHHPIIKDQYGPWFRLDSLNKRARQGQAAK
jgi:hypothetical protein